MIFFTAKKAYNSQFLGLPYICRHGAWKPATSTAPWSPQEPRRNGVDDGVDVEAGELFAFDGTLDHADELHGAQPWVDDDIDLLEVREQACMVRMSATSARGLVVLSSEVPADQKQPIANLLAAERGLVGHGADV